jgi:hypothetical protein
MRKFANEAVALRGGPQEIGYKVTKDMFAGSDKSFSSVLRRAEWPASGPVVQIAEE